MSEDNLAKPVLDLFINASKILKEFAPKERRKIDDMTAVFVDNLNGKLVGRRALSFDELMVGIIAGSKPIGLILENWDDPDWMQVKEFPDLTTEEQQVLINEFAKAQDEARETFGDLGND